MRESNFLQAAEAINFGVRLLTEHCPRFWRENYDLPLDIYNAAAEASQCVAECDPAMELIVACQRELAVVSRCSGNGCDRSLYSRSERRSGSSNRHRLGCITRNGRDILDATPIKMARHVLLLQATLQASKHVNESILSTCSG